MGRKEILAARDKRIAERHGQSEASLKAREESLAEFNRRLVRGQLGYITKAKLIANESKKSSPKEE